MTLRLAVVTHNVIKGDGQGRANLEIVRHAARSGIAVTLIADRVDDDLLKEDGISWAPVQPKIRSNWLLHGLEFQARANKILDRRRKDFDVIHGYGFCLNRPHHINTSQFVHSAWRQSPVHTARGQRSAYGAYQWLFSAVNAWGEQQAYAKADAVVAASNTVRAELLSIGVPEKSLHVILNGADPAEFHPGEADRAALGLPVDGPLALFAGDLRTNRKNLDSVLKAMALLGSSDLQLVVVGKIDGSPFPKMAEELGITGRVHFLDFRRDIASIMRAVDMFVFPSRYEACALVLVEAIASGLPVITARTTGGSEVIRPDSGVLLDDPNDVEALAAALSKLADDAPLRASMSKAAADESKKHTWETVSEAYLKLYREAAGAS
jgi:glycosyltransferase involved in cell wall biosynthesis